MKTLPSSRKHHYLARVGIFLIAVALVVGVIGCDGDGPEDGDVVKIQTWSDLDAIRNNQGGKYVLVNSLNSTTAGYEELVSDTANEGKGWEPIRGFTGTFDGNGYEIKDLFINRDKEDQVGLFGYIPEANLKDITVLGANVTGRENVGIVVGESRGTMENCSSSGSVTGMNSIGGLAGYNGGYGLVSSNVRYCESTATVCGEERRTGGIVGYNAPRGYIDSSVFGGNVIGVYQVGGLVGLNNREVKKSVVEVTVNVTGVSAVGGLVGWSTPLTVVEECCFYGHANGGPYVGCDVLLSEGSAVTSLSVDSYEIGWYVGGVVGVNEGTVKDCSAEATVEGYQYVGGLAGTNEGTVEDCGSDSKVTGDSNVGGLIGENQGTLDSCSCSGDVTGDSEIGRLVGYNTGAVSNSDSTSWVTGTSDGGDLVGRNEGVISGVRYNLRLSSTSGGSVTSPGEGTFAYNEGEVINLVATPDAGYHFVIWNAPAGKFANPNAATTTFTMPPQDVTATAHFVGPLDHFNCYLAEDERDYIPLGEVVYLEDQFGAVQAEVGYAAWFCSPVEKQHDGVTPISNPDHHLTIYSLDYEEEFNMGFVEIVNQFGTQQLIVSGPVGLAVPTQKEGHEPPVGLDHFLLYEVTEGPSVNPSVNVIVGLDDQFGDQPEVLVIAPIGFAIPVQKTHGGVVTEIEDPMAHLVFYEIEGEEFEAKVQVVNQFGAQTLDMVGPYLLAVPSEKVYYKLIS